MTRYRTPPTIGRMERTCVAAPFLQDAPVLLQMADEDAAFHDGTFIGTRMLTGIFSMKMAFLSLALGFGEGSGSPISI